MVESDVGGDNEDSEVYREERKRGEIRDFIVVVDSAEDILWRTFFLFNFRWTTWILCLKIE